PALDRCVGCDAESAAELERAIVDAGRGGLLCPRCAGSARGTIRAAPPAARERLLGLERLSLAEAATLLPAGPELEAATREIMAALLGGPLGRVPRSVEFMKKLREAAGA